MGRAQSEIRALRATEALKDKALEEVKKKIDQHSSTPALISRKSLDWKM